MVYFSFFITIIGLSSICNTYLNTPWDILSKCELGMNFISCKDAPANFSITCVYTHHFKQELGRWIISNPALLSAMLIFFIYLAYEPKKHNLFCLLMYIIPLLLLILQQCLPSNIVPFQDEIDVTLQSLMLVFCLSFISFKKCGKKQREAKSPKFDKEEFALFNMAQSANYDSNRSGIELLEEQERNESATPPPFMVQRSLSASQPSYSLEEKGNNQSLFGSFNGNKNVNKVRNEWVNINDPFKNYQPKRNHNGYDNGGYNYRDNGGFGVSQREPMDICSPRQNSMNSNSIRRGINDLDLNQSYQSYQSF